MPAFGGGASAAGQFNRVRRTYQPVRRHTRAIIGPALPVAPFAQSDYPNPVHISARIALYDSGINAFMPAAQTVIGQLDWPNPVRLLPRIQSVLYEPGVSANAPSALVLAITVQLPDQPNPVRRATRTYDPGENPFMPLPLPQPVTVSGSAGMGRGGGS